VCELLQRKYGAGFDMASQWVSSARTRVLPSTAGLGRADDAAGFDFQVEDRQQWLVLAQGAAFVRCYIEVKVRRLPPAVLWADGRCADMPPSAAHAGLVADDAAQRAAVRCAPRPSSRPRACVFQRAQGPRCQTPCRAALAHGPAGST
jgi:hypothetical protein